MSATTRDTLAVRAGLMVSQRLRRLLKLGATSVMLATGGYAIWSAQGYVVSDNAVVSAYLTSLRTPIEGYISSGRAVVGAEIHGGDILAVISNQRVDDQHLADLEDQVRRLAREEAALAREHETLVATEHRLIEQGQEYHRGLLARLSGQLLAAKMALGAKQAESEQAKREYTRKITLAHSGTASAADLDKAQYASAVLERQVQSLAGELAAIQAQQDAAERGITTEGGGNDVTYSMQRADEVQLRLAEVDRQLDTVRGEKAAASARAELERHRVGLLRSAVLAAPAAAMLWKVGASDGERLGTGDTAAQLVDCGSAFLVATIPQSAYADVELGGEARFRLSGESAERTGRIISVTGDTSLTGDRNLAAVPVEQNKPTAMVRIAAPPSRNIASECLVGRTARVLLPTIQHNVMDLAARTVRRIF